MDGNTLHRRALFPILYAGNASNGRRGPVVHRTSEILATKNAAEPPS